MTQILTNVCNKKTYKAFLSSEIYNGNCDLKKFMTIYDAHFKLFLLLMLLMQKVSLLKVTSAIACL